MATNKDTVKLEINIAGELIKLTVPFKQQDSVRDTEKAINKLYSDWRVKYPRKTSSELLAMIAYQFASFYYELSDRYETLAEGLSDVSGELDSIIGDDLI